MNSLQRGEVASAAQRPGWLWFERFLCLLVLAGFAYTLAEFIRIGKPPQPFIFDINDTFMDWFNTSFFGRQKFTYISWKSVYPPISFAFLNVVGLARCYGSDPIQARDCDILGIFFILLLYFVCALTAYIAFRSHDRKSACVRGVAFLVSLPLLFTLERGNLILFCLIPFGLYYGDIVKSLFGRSLLLALNINFKPYLLILTVALLVRREWRTFEIIGIFSLLIYLLSFAMIGKGTPFEIIQNLRSFATLKGGLIYEDFFYSTSFAPFLELNTWRVPGRDFIDGRFIENAAIWIPILIGASQLIIVITLLGAWLQPRCLDEKRIALLLLGAALITQSPGGYTMTFIVLLVFLEKPTTAGLRFAILMAYLLCVPYDYVFARFLELEGTNWVTGRSLKFPIGPSVGMFVRPLLIILMIWAVAFDSLMLIWHAHRHYRPSLGMMPGAHLADPR